MSCGFDRHPNFKILAAVDAQIGKPSNGKGSLECNSTYRLNIGIQPAPIDLSNVEPDNLRALLGIGSNNVDVLCVCPPCTGFSRANPGNHLEDDERNSLVVRSAKFALALDASVVIMENARELIRGNFNYHCEEFTRILESAGYTVGGRIHFLNQFGLPQIRERALVIAVKKPLEHRSIDDLWHGWELDKAATHVRAALKDIPKPSDPAQKFPSFSSEIVRKRMLAIPRDGGSWIDLTRSARTRALLTPAMVRILEAGKVGSYPDIYGRMWWDRPAPTIKRECGHVGNGRYAHPYEHRLMSVREMSVLQGFPKDYQFNGAALSNLYRHIGDAVPPLISYQLAWIASWIFSGKKPDLPNAILPATHLQQHHLRPYQVSLKSSAPELIYATN